MKLTTSLQKNQAEIDKTLKSDDIEKMPLTVGKKNALMIFAKEMVDKHSLGELILRPLNNFKGRVNEKTLLATFLSPEKKTVSTISDSISEITMGNTLLIVDGVAVAFAFGIKRYEKRAIAEPPTSTVIKGPREGFVESLPVNVSLMRRKIKSPDLRFMNLEVGKYSKTAVSLCYIKGIADDNLVNAIKEKIKTIDIDAVLDSSYISKFLGSHRHSVFKQVGNTEKPDILASKILEGRVAIFVDGSPIALTAPYLIMEDFQSPSDYYSSPITASFARILRLFSVILSIILPSFLVASELFHLQLIPLNFLLTITNSIKGMPLSPSYEMFFTLLIFEILNEASIRMPRYVGMVVSIVGGLVLGETAVNAGIISAPTLMIIALSGICLYTVPELEQTFSFLRLIYLIVAGTFGLYGILAATVMLVLYLVTFENFSTPLCAPYSPLVRSDLKDGFIKKAVVNSGVRPLSINTKNRHRIEKEKGENNAL